MWEILIPSIIPIISVMLIPILVVLYEYERDKEFDEYMSELYGEIWEETKRENDW